MCGISGIYAASAGRLVPNQWSQLMTSLLLFSETRGKESTGFAIASANSLHICKEVMSASKMLKLKHYQEYLLDKFTAADPGGSLSVIGHNRLITNGMQDSAANNQPVRRGDITMAHNGIAINHQSLWELLPESYKPESQIDTEALAATVEYEFQSSKNMAAALLTLYERLKGDASVAFLHTGTDGLFLATNVGSLYYCIVDETLIFASERLILEKLFRARQLKSFLPSREIIQLKPGEALFCTRQNIQLSVKTFSVRQVPALPVMTAVFRKLEDHSQRFEQARKNMRRCTRCILPETMPFIQFDTEGVCNYCHSHAPMQTKSKDMAKDFLSKYRSAKGDLKALVMLSGGRDSCYGLHYAVNELDIKPIAYTYDWGLVTDIARRNTSRMCSALGVEHIIVSADIPWKRRNVRKNILAWLNRPALGMVPLFMAGDKQYFHYANQVRRANQLPVTLVSENPLELTRFKSGFCGIDESGSRVYDIPYLSQLKLLGYYAGQYMKNPRYLNSTILDSAFAFFSFYIAKHDYLHIYEYEKWNEDKINSTLIEQYGWETDPGAHSTWRIGDGTAAFYNYIYHTMAGFTENDTLRSNQIREGMISREHALEKVERENQPRWDSLAWYASVIGFSLTDALRQINLAPKLYYAD